MIEANGQAVIIFDSHRGIYFGYLEEVDLDRHIVRLEKGRHIFYRPATGDPKCEGNYSLAVVGIKPGGKVGPPCEMVIFDVAKIVPCTKEAEESLRHAKWE